MGRAILKISFPMLRYGRRVIAPEHRVIASKRSPVFGEEWLIEGPWLPESEGPWLPESEGPPHLNAAFTLMHEWPAVRLTCEWMIGGYSYGLFEVGTWPDVPAWREWLDNQPNYHFD